jgi:5-methylcytosine-specific restriction enzyme subunit McrC
MERTDCLKHHVLRERVTAACHLALDDVHFLTSQHRRHIALAPTQKRGVFLVTPRGFVGAIRAPHCRLTIRPKVPLRNLFLMLDPESPIPETGDQSHAGQGTEALEFLAHRLARLLEQRAAAGLHRAYVERAVEGPMIQGRLDLLAQLRRPTVRKDTIHSCYEELSADVLCNQLPKATAELVLRWPLLGESARGALRHALRAFSDISSPPLDLRSFAAVEWTRVTQAYRPLLKLCRLLVESFGPRVEGRALDLPSFLLDMERVFENYVTQTVTAAFVGSECEVEAQPSYTVNCSIAGQPDLLMRPDIVVRRDGRPVLVVDAKWKAGKETPIIRDDVHQALAYASALAAPRVVLVYPGKHDRKWPYLLEHSAIRLDIRQLRVVGSAEQCRKSRQRLGRFIATAAANSPAR